MVKLQNKYITNTRHYVSVYCATESIGINFNFAIKFLIAVQGNTSDGEFVRHQDTGVRWSTTNAKFHAKCTGLD